MSGHASSYTDGTIAHDDRETRHTVTVVADTQLHTITGKSQISVNSFHREALVRVSDAVTVNAISPDGLIEGIERQDKAFAVGVQWHPERLIEENADASALFAAFVRACAKQGLN